MSLPYGALLRCVQYLAPTWRKTQHTNLTQLVAALFERPTLCETELARAMPAPDQALHGRLKRLLRFLDNPRVDECALYQRWLALTYRFGLGDALGPAPDGRPWLPILLDTTYFEPFAALVAAVPCGSRALPVALTTYHRHTLEACFPPEATWGTATERCPIPPRRAHAGRGRAGRLPPRGSRPEPFLSQNQIEEQLVRLLEQLVSPALTPVLVADRGFARAAWFRWLLDRHLAFVVRIDAPTHVYLRQASDAAHARVDVALALQPGQRRWWPDVLYHAEERVPMHLLGIWDAGQAAPWYLVTPIGDPAVVETLYRWRMRLESTNRDTKTGVLLREGDDHHALRSLQHLHRLLLAVVTAEWLCALTGLQAWADLPARPIPEAATTPAAPSPLPSPPRPIPTPAQPPPVVPHRGPVPKLAPWQRRFAVRGHLSYVRLGLEVLRAPDLHWLVAHLAHWLGDFLDWLTPIWRPWQRRYRRRHWWACPL